MVDRVTQKYNRCLEGPTKTCETLKLEDDDICLNDLSAGAECDAKCNGRGASCVENCRNLIVCDSADIITADHCQTAKCIAENGPTGQCRTGFVQDCGKIIDSLPPYLDQLRDECTTVDCAAYSGDEQAQCVRGCQSGRNILDGYGVPVARDTCERNANATCEEVRDILASQSCYQGPVCNCFSAERVCYSKCYEITLGCARMAPWWYQACQAQQVP